MQFLQYVCLPSLAHYMYTFLAVGAFFFDFLPLVGVEPKVPG